MKLWYLMRLDDKTWEENTAAVVRAKTAKRSRAIAASSAGSEGSDPWLDATRSTCVELKASGEEGLIIASNAGA